jgi:signal transduction histidine kinase
MAEVAISVLHNVGNVLNSVNVSAAIVEEKINSPIAHDLAKAVGLLRQYEQNPASLLAADGSGKKMVAYLEAFARHLAEEKAAIADEIKCLARNVEHIKEIVAMQQSYAKAAGVQEIVSPTVLVEDALHMNQADYEQQGIVIHRDFARVPDIIVDRHKVIQILVNLLKNARHACRDNAPVKGDVAVHVGMAGADRVKIEVADNGVGIPAENLTRIFAYGFTTRQGGHGYGLHSGALAAKEMGGSLLASSDGPGRGARFILELPLAQPASAGETDNSPA